MKTIWLKVTCEIVSLVAFIFYYKVVALKEKMKEKAIQNKKNIFWFIAVQVQLAATK